MRSGGVNIAGEGRWVGRGWDYNKSMLGFRRRASGRGISTEECRQLMSKEFKQLVDQHIINEQQEELVEHYSHARETDLSREENIKQKLNARFFNVPKPKKRKISPKMPAPEPHLQLRQRMSQEMKDSLTLSRSRPPPSSRYARKSSSPRPPNSPRSPLPSSPHSATLDASSLFTLQLNDLIASSQRRPAVSSSLKRNIVTATDRKKRHEREFHSQREEIIDKIIENDVEELMRCQARGGSVGDARGLIEAIRREELSNLDKYSMSFTNYMRQKTYKNIEKAIYNDRIRQKQTYVEKFQDFILTEFKFSQQARRRLEKIFRNIELEHKRPSRNRQISERLPRS